MTASNRGFTGLRCLALCFVLGFGTSANSTRASEEDEQAKEIEEALVKLSQAFKDRDVAVIKRLTTPDHIAITPFYGEPKARAEEIESLAEFQMTEYTEGKFDVRFLSKEVVLITYPLQLKGTNHSCARPWQMC